MESDEQMLFPDFPPPDPPHPLAGKPYDAGTAEEMTVFERMFCDFCTKRPDDLLEVCRVIDVSMVKGASPQEWTHDYRGRPICTAFEERDDG